MTQNLNLPSILARLRDIADQPVILSTDGRQVRLLIHEHDSAHSGRHYTDLAPDAADELAAALTGRSRPRPARGRTRWLPRWGARR
ncbi:hypothetical protein ACFYO1_03220 [Nocardia sp. NPDC006044]|uniref:hypothetical protein n=1 Tax=Nocardia sp. NPDC006044 TaxID=3364306 RepID=UPI00369C3E41